MSLPPPVVLPAPAGPPLWRLAAALPSDRWPVLLDGGACPAGDDRWALLVFDPVDTLVRRVTGAPVADRGARALARLEAALDRAWPGRGPEGHAPADDELPPFRGGAVAMLGYDLGRELERLPDLRGPTGWPDLVAGVYPFVLAEERATGRRLVVGRGSAAGARDMLAKVVALGDAVGDTLHDAPAAAPPSQTARSARSSLQRSAYLAAVAAVREHILDGDVYQVNLSQRFDVPWSGSIAALGAALCVSNPVPFGAVLRTPELTLCSNSPELFLRRRGDRLVSRPIKGTRPRGADAAADALLRAELEGSAKEHAELAMIVDLVRNDLGRVASIGSVTVELPFVTEAWATVFHRVVAVGCRLPAGARAVDIVEACFPPASVTGTPKLAALAVIEQLEPVRRGPYTGALGWFDAGGDLDLSVSIRIAVHDGQRLSVPVGGGITLASDPAAEYDETLHKARAFFDVLGLDLSPRMLLT